MRVHVLRPGVRLLGHRRLLVRSVGEHVRVRLRGLRVRTRRPGAEPRSEPQTDARSDGRAEAEAVRKSDRKPDRSLCGAVRVTDEHVRRARVLDEL